MEHISTVCAGSVHSVCMLMLDGHAAAKAESRGTHSLSLYTPLCCSLCWFQPSKLEAYIACTLHPASKRDALYRGLLLWASMDAILCAKCLQDFQLSLHTICVCARPKKLWIITNEGQKLKAQNEFFKAWLMHMIMTSTSRICGNYLYHLYWRSASSCL